MGKLRENIVKSALVLMALLGEQMIFGSPVFGVTDPTITINLTPPPVLDLVAGHFSSVSSSAEITTDNYTGYTVSLKNNNATTDLVNLDDNTLTIPTITLPNDSSSITANDFSHGYGISVDGINYVPAPDSTSSIALGGSSSAGTGTNTFYFGAEVEGGTEAGTYQKTFIIVAVVNNPQFSFTYEENAGTDTVSNMPSDVSAEVSSDGSATLASEIPTRSGYTFLGWDEDDTATTPTYAKEDTNTITLEPTQANAITLYAIWEERSGGNPSIIEGSGTSSDPYVDTDMEYDSSTIIAEDGHYTFPNVDGEPEVVVENGEVVSFAYTDTGDEGVELTTDGVDTGVLAFNGSDFTIILNASFPWTTNARSPIINLSGIVNNATSGFVLNNSYYSQQYTNPEGTTYTSNAYINRFRCFQYANNSLSNTYNLIYQSYTGTTNRYTLGWLESAAPLTATIVVTGTVNGSATNIDVKAYSSYDSSTGTGTLLGKLPSSVSYSLSGLASSGITVQLGTYELSGTTFTYPFTVYEFSVQKSSSS
ncbi:InlB B-repeat-containing protein [Candidatus Saccharibacteria bacterium]|nr:InlB B-repeat-containing protein [Candidatus Saccharibacteria bacterium]